MKKAIRKTLVILLAVCMMSSLSAAAFADGTADAAQCWNIMLVIDGSRSLSTGIAGVATDPSGLRYEAIDSFIDTLQDSGQYVGAIEFMANPGTGTSEEEMYKGIRLDTWKDGPVPIENNKANLKKQIRNANLTSHESGKIGETDIGTALYWAEKRLEQAHKENGLPCALFLFTDGLNALTYPGPEKQSRQNMAEATAALRNNGVAVCGVFLNTSNKQIDSAEVRDIVCEANGIAAGDLDLGNYFIEINNAADCAQSTDRFMELLGFHFGNSNGEAISSSCEKSFRIPGTGVEEVNIRVRTLTGESLPEGMLISITEPNGNVLSGATAAAICSSGRTYRIFKISQPEAGTWTVHIDLPKNNKVMIDYNPIFSIYVDSAFESNPGAEDLHANMNAEVTSFLTKKGSRVTEGKDYREYYCELEVTNTQTGETETYPVTKNSSDEFIVSVPLDYGVYDVRTTFSCDQISVSSPKTTWFLENHAPTATNLDKAITFNIFNFGGMKKDLSDYFDDIEDGKEILLSAAEGDIAGVEFNGKEIIVSPTAAKSGEYIVRATDSQGASTDFQVTLKNTTLLTILLIIAALIALAILILIFIRKRNSFIPKGVCTLEFDVSAEDDHGNEKEVTINAELAAPGNGTKRKTNLYEMIDDDLKRQAGSIRSTCDEEGISFRAVEKFVDSIEQDLKKIKVSCVVAAQKNKGKTAKVKVQNGKINSILYNNSVKLTPGGHAVGFGYYLRDDEDFGEEEWSYNESETDEFESSVYDDYNDSYNNDYSDSRSSNNSSDDEF